MFVNILLFLILTIFYFNDILIIVAYFLFLLGGRHMVSFDFNVFGLRPKGRLVKIAIAIGLAIVLIPLGLLAWFTQGLLNLIGLGDRYRVFDLRIRHDDNDA